MGKAKVSVVKIGVLEGNASFMGGEFVRIKDDVKKTEAAVARAVTLAIGSPNAIIESGQTALIKPNLAFRAHQRTMRR